MGTTTAQDIGSRQRRRETMLSPFATAPGVGKDLVRHWLWCDGWSDDKRHPKYHPLVDNALVVASELITNVYKHVNLPCKLIYDVTADGPVVAVWDPLPRLPEPPRFIDAEQVDIDQLPEFGLGMGVIASLSAAWGARHCPYPQGGKIVWAQFSTALPRLGTSG